jgi:hypothetical protein
MLRGQYCWMCEREGIGKRQAYHYESIRLGVRMPLCKTHKKLDGKDGYPKIKRAMLVNERKAIKLVRSYNKDGEGFLSLLYGSPIGSALDRLEKQGKVVFKHGNSKNFTKRGYWVV